MNATTAEMNEKTDLRAHFETAIEKAKHAWEGLEEKTVAAARTTDQAVRTHPYRTAGLAFGLGLLAGVVIMRSRRNQA